MQKKENDQVENFYRVWFLFCYILKYDWKINNERNKQVSILRFFNSYFLGKFYLKVLECPRARNKRNVRSKTTFSTEFWCELFELCLSWKCLTFASGCLLDLCRVKNEFLVSLIISRRSFTLKIQEKFEF